MNRVGLISMAILCCTSYAIAEDAVRLRISPAIFNSILLPNGKCFSIGTRLDEKEPSTIILQQDENGDLVGVWEFRASFENTANFSVRVVRLRNSGKTIVTATIRNEDQIKISENVIRLSKSDAFAFPEMELTGNIGSAANDCHPYGSLTIAAGRE